MTSKKKAKVIKYCIFKVTNETEDKEAICLSGPKELEKQVKNLWGDQKKKKTKEIMGALYNIHDLHEMVKYEEFYERSYVEEFRANC